MTLLAALFATVVATAALAQQPEAPKTLKAEETAIILVDFQANFTHPEGTWYNRFKPVYDKNVPAIGAEAVNVVLDALKKARGG